MQISHLVNDGEVVEQGPVADGEGDEGAHGGGVREVHPDRGLALGQHDGLLLLLLLDEGHELLVSVHVDHGGGGRHDDAGQEVEQHRDGSVQQEWLVLVEDILGSDHLDFVHDGHGGEGHEVLHPVAHELHREQEGDPLVGLPEDGWVSHREHQQGQRVVEVLGGAGVPVDMCRYEDICVDIDRY